MSAAPQPFLNNWMLAALGLIFISLPELVLAPMFSDHGLYMWVAQTFNQGGGLPDIGAWDHKGPLFHFINAAVLRVHNSFAAIRVFDAALLLGSFAAIAYLLRPVIGWAGASLAIILWLLFASNLYAWSAQPDLWGAHLLIGLVLVLLSSKSWKYYAAGAFMGLLVLFKLPFILFGLLGVVAIAHEGKWLRSSWQAALGFMVPVAAIALLYMAHGTLGNLWATYILFNIEAHSQPFPRPELTLLTRLTLTSAFHFEQGKGFVLLWEISKWLLALVALLGTIKLRRIHARLADLLLAGFVAGYFYAFLPGRFFGSHFFPVTVFAVCLAAAGFRLGPNWLSQTVLVLVLAIKGSSFLLSANHLELAGWQYLQGQMSKADYLAEHTYDIYDASLAQLAADKVQALTKPDERVQVWGFYVVLNTLAQRTPSSRFGFNYPLLQESRWRYEWRGEFEKALGNLPPKLILVQKNDAGLLKPLSSKEALETYPEFRTWLQDHYQQVDQDEFFDYYLKR